MIRALLLVAVLAASGVAWLAVSRASATSSVPHPIVVRAGDEIRVLGAPVGCRVVHMRGFAGRLVVDCRRTGNLRGTYGTLLSGREVGLVRFESDHTGKLLYRAAQYGSIRKCGTR
ncbi:MAG: hypothetical protein ACJ74D_14045 [Gaiellaceae bacterium]